jgi:hypothetical protein
MAVKAVRVFLEDLWLFWLVERPGRSDCCEAEPVSVELELTRPFSIFNRFAANATPAA